MENSLKKIFLMFLAFSAAGLILFSNIIAFNNNCLETYDLGLYFQALVNMADGDLNPFLTVRTLNIFNDHFEPILLLAVSSIWLTGGSALGPIIFEWLTLIVFIFLLVRFKSYKNVLSIIFLCLLSRGVLTALVFPVHPNTWSMLIWPFLALYIHKNNFKGILLTGFLLILFRESNVFILPGLMIYFFLSREWKKLLLTSLASLLALFVVFKLRVMIFGESYDYGGVFIRSLLDDHIFYIWKQLADLDLKGFLKVFGPVLIPLFYVLKNEKRSILKSPFTKLFCMLGPVFFLHLMANKIHYHYGITFIAPILAYIILSPKFSALVSDKKWIGLTFILFFATASSTYTKWFKLSILNKTNKCIMTKEKRASMREFKSIFNKKVPLDATVFSSRRIVPKLMAAKRKIYVPSHFTTHRDSYDYLLMEKNFGGEFRSLTEDRYKKMLELCDVRNFEVLVDNKYFFLMKGPIKSSCFGYFSFM